MESDEYYNVQVQPLVLYEMQRASMDMSKEDICMQIVLNIARLLNVSLNNQNRIFISKSFAYLKDDFENNQYFQALKINEWNRKSNVLKFLNQVSKLQVRDGKPLILSLKLMKALAVDQIHFDLKHFIDNLKIDDKITNDYHSKHVRGVRRMYEVLSPLITGTDAAIIIYLSLMKMYQKCEEEDTSFNEDISNCENHLFMHSKNFIELENIPFEEMYSAYYLLNWGGEMERVLRFKFSQVKKYINMKNKKD